MNFERHKPVEQIGEFFGFIFSYFLFTTILFFVMMFLHKLPQGWTYIHIIGITISITIAGALLKRFLK